MSKSMTRDVTDKAKESAEQMNEKASEIMHGARDTAAEFSHRAQESFGAIKEAAADYIDQGRDKVEALGSTVGEQVKERPLSALIVAMGVGLLLGVVLARR